MKRVFEFETDPDDIYFVDEDRLKELEEKELNQLNEEQ